MSQKDDRDNRANQLNPNNAAYISSRAGSCVSDDDDDGYAHVARHWPALDIRDPRLWTSVFEANFVALDGVIHRELVHVSARRITPPEPRIPLEAARRYFLDRRQSLAAGTGGYMAYCSLNDPGRDPYMCDQFKPLWSAKKTLRLAGAVQYWKQAEIAQKQLRACFAAAKSAFFDLAESRPVTCPPEHWRQLIARWQERFKDAYRAIPDTPSVSGQQRFYGWNKLAILYPADIRAAELDLADAGIMNSVLPPYSKVIRLARVSNVLSRAANHRCAHWAQSPDDGAVDDPFESFWQRHGQSLKNTLMWYQTGAHAVAALDAGSDEPRKIVEIKC